MSKQHPNVKALRQVRLNARLNMPDSQVDALDWAIRVCEAADALINVKGRNHSETAYRRLEAAVKEEADS